MIVRLKHLLQFPSFPNQKIFQKKFKGTFVEGLNWIFNFRKQFCETSLCKILMMFIRLVFLNSLEKQQKENFMKTKNIHRNNILILFMTCYTLFVDKILGNTFPWQQILMIFVTHKCVTKPCVNFTNVLRTPFTHADHKSIKRHQCLFMLLCFYAWLSFFNLLDLCA